MSDHEQVVIHSKMASLGLGLDQDFSSPLSTKSPALKSYNSPVPPPSSVTRLWRPAAQRNLRNQWSKLASYMQQWLSSSNKGRAHATDLINAYLSQSYLPSMELGALSDMPNIRNNASSKLFKQQESHASKLLLCYKDMVTILSHMVNSSRTLRTFEKGSCSSAIVQFSSTSYDKNDSGDCGGIPAFTFLSISSFEKLAKELVQMFEMELNMKRWLVMVLLSLGSGVPHVNQLLCWSDELYLGEFNDLSICNLYPMDTCEPVLPKLRGMKPDMSAVQSNSQPNQEAFKTYLTAWLAEVNIDTVRLNEIFAVVGEEMHVTLS